MLHNQDLAAIEEVRTKVEQAWAAWKEFRAYSQEQVDAITEAMAAAGRDNALRLAEMAVEETGYGNVRDKLAKNLLCSDLLGRAMRGMKTVGVLREIPEQKIVEYGVPMGVVAAILPTTNPTSTAIYKTLISVKGGNAIVISPHPRAKACTAESARVLARAAVAAGAPEGLIQCIAEPTIEATQALMKQDRVAVILSTGGSGIVKAAYSSGKPAFGVGPGNVPVLLDPSADLNEAIAKVVAGKSFDYGTVCSSEQTLVAERGMRDRIMAALKERKAYLCSPAQCEALAKLLITPNWTVNSKCVGQAPGVIARMAGFEVPTETSILVTEIAGVGKQHPLSAEKLSPVLSLLFVDGFDAALDACEAILRFGGLGHTCVIHAGDDGRIRKFGQRMPANRVLVNTSAPQGSVGITTNVFPAMTLGCGAAAGNSTGDNVSPLHLINIKRLAWAVRRPEEALVIPDVAAAGAKATRMMERQTVIAAVEQYLAQRGISIGAPRASAASSTVPPPAEAVIQHVAEARASSCGGSDKQAAKPAPAPEPPEPQIPTVDFVCESDVRTAIGQSRKIYIGPKTIITPSARDLASAHDTLVMAQP